MLRADPDLRNRVEERLKDAEHQAMAMLDDRKEGLERLAKELAREGMLGGDRLRNLLASEGTARAKTAQVSGCPSGSSGLISP